MLISTIWHIFLQVFKPFLAFRWFCGHARHYCSDLRTDLSVSNLAVPDLPVLSVLVNCLIFCMTKSLHAPWLLLSTQVFRILECILLSGLSNCGIMSSTLMYDLANWKYFQIKPDFLISAPPLFECCTGVLFLPVTGQSSHHGPSAHLTTSDREASVAIWGRHHGDHISKWAFQSCSSWDHWEDERWSKTQDHRFRLVSISLNAGYNSNGTGVPELYVKPYRLK